MSTNPKTLELRGECRVMFAFDVGHEIDLAGTASTVRDPSTAGTLGHTHPAPSHFQFAPPPLRVAQRDATLTLGRWSTTQAIEVVLFEFGAVLVSYSIPFAGTLDDCVELSCALAADRTLAAAAQRRVVELAQGIEAQITKPGTAEILEDYQVFRFAEEALGADADKFVAQHGLALARVLRAERGALANEETADALATRLQYAPSDCAVLDWHAAVLFDDDPEDVLRVLEYANVQLLEMRFLDAQLDRALEGSARLVSRRGARRWLGPLALHRDLERLAAMHVEAAFLFERLGNTLKVSGDQYLARVLRQAGARFRLREWNEAAQRKLAALDDIYDKMHDHASTLRAEFLEWLIVILIVLEIALSLIGARG